MDEIAFDLCCVLKKEYFLQIFLLFSILSLMEEVCPKWSYINTHCVYTFQGLVAIEIKLQF